MDYWQVQLLEGSIQSHIDSALSLPGVIGLAAVDALMVNWFSGGGTLDFSSVNNFYNGQKFNVGLGAPLTDAQAGNYMAGYAGGYAAFESGDASFMVGVIGVGAGYGAADILFATFGKGGGGLASGFTGYGSSLNMQYNGMFQGAMDALLGD